VVRDVHDCLIARRQVFASYQLRPIAQANHGTFGPQRYSEVNSTATEVVAHLRVSVGDQDERKEHTCPHKRPHQEAGADNNVDRLSLNLDLSYVGVSRQLIGVVILASQKTEGPRGTRPGRGLTMQHALIYTHLEEQIRYRMLAVAPHYRSRKCSASDSSGGESYRHPQRGGDVIGKQASLFGRAASGHSKLNGGNPRPPKMRNPGRQANRSGR
jgi:hypothetical protein